MTERWRELEAIAERLRRLGEELHRDDLRRDAETIAAIARVERRHYVEWLWGYG